MFLLSRVIEPDSTETAPPHTHSMKFSEDWLIPDSVIVMWLFIISVPDTVNEPFLTEIAPPYENCSSFLCNIVKSI